MLASCGIAGNWRVVASLVAPCAVCFVLQAAETLTASRRGRHPLLQREELKHARAVNDKLKSEKQLSESTAASNLVQDAIPKMRPSTLAHERAFIFLLDAAKRELRCSLFKKWQHFTNVNICRLRHREATNLRRMLARLLGVWKRTRLRQKRRERLSLCFIRRVQRVLVRSALLHWIGVSRKRCISRVAGMRVFAKCNLTKIRRSVRAWRHASRCCLKVKNHSSDVCIGKDMFCGGGRQGASF